MDEQTFFEKYKSIAREFGMKFYGNGYVCINRFAASGMSSGVVGEEFVRQGWYELRRRNRLYRSDEVASDIIACDAVRQNMNGMPKFESSTELPEVVPIETDKKDETATDTQADTELIAKLLSNPETAALLKALASKL